MATATRGLVDVAVEIIPKGMFAREKCDPRGILNHDRREVILSAILLSFAARPGEPGIAELRRLRGVNLTQNEVV
jgi:hypothetical protein